MWNIHQFLPGAVRSKSTDGCQYVCLLQCLKKTKGLLQLQCKNHWPTTWQNWTKRILQRLKIGRVGDTEKAAGGKKKKKKKKKNHWQKLKETTSTRTLYHDDLILMDEWTTAGEADKNRNLTDPGKCTHLYDETQGNRETQALSTEKCLRQVQEDGYSFIIIYLRPDITVPVDWA